jgi:sortase A
MRRFVSPFLNLVIAAGLIVAVWPVGQSLYGQWSQRSLAAQWQQSEKAPRKPSQVSKTTTSKAKAGKTSKSGTPVKLARHDPSSPAPAGTAPRKAKRAPWPLTKLTIPDIALETFVVQGMDDASLRRGPGHDPNSSAPGQGNCVIAGHRNVYGSFFYRLDELQSGSLITLENRNGTFNYIVNEVFVTPDTNLTVLQEPPAGAPPVLTLITCTLPHTNNRIILQASLSSG